MKVLFYGRLAEAIGPELEVGASPGASIADVRERLAAEHPHAADVLRNKRALSFVGDRLVRDDYSLALGDTLEFLPPVSGG
jgi:molybdopterin converting factor small subunit